MLVHNTIEAAKRQTERAASGAVQFA